MTTALLSAVLDLFKANRSVELYVGDAWSPSLGVTVGGWS